jgi:hypothetical protein
MGRQATRDGCIEMPAKIQRTIKNVETIHGVKNPEYNPAPDTPLIQLVVLSDNTDPPQWSTKVETEYVEFPSHGAAEQRAKQINTKYPWIYCYARVIERGPNQRPTLETIPLQPPLIPLAETVAAAPSRGENESGDRAPLPQKAKPEPKPANDDDEIMRARLSDATTSHRMRTLRKLAKKKTAPVGASATKPGWWREPEREVRLPYRDD